MSAELFYLFTHSTRGVPKFEEIHASELEKKLAFLQRNQEQLQRKRERDAERKRALK